MLKKPADPEGLRLLAEMQTMLSDPDPLFEHLQLLGSELVDRLPAALLLQTEPPF